MEDLQDLPGFGEKSAGKLLEEIEEAKKRPLDALIFALGIPNVGRRTAGDLASAFGSLEAFLQADRESLVAIDEIGDQVASGILDYLGKEENFTYQVFVKEQAFKLPSGTYLLRHIDTDTYMTSAGNKNPVTFQPLSGATPSREQLWRIVDESDAAQYTVTSVADSCYLSSLARLTTTAIKNLFRIDRAAGLQRYAFYLRTTRYMNVTADGTVTLTDKLLTSFPFEFIPYNDSTDGISTIQHDRKAMSGASAIYDLLGRRIMNADKEQSQPYRLRPGVYVVNGRKVVCQ
jgi:NAD-dependent DNA ligase